MKRFELCWLARPRKTENDAKKSWLVKRPRRGKLKRRKANARNEASSSPIKTECTIIGGIILYLNKLEKLSTNLLGGEESRDK